MARQKVLLIVSTDAVVGAQFDDVRKVAWVGGYERCEHVVRGIVTDYFLEENEWERRQVQRNKFRYVFKCDEDIWQKGIDGMTSDGIVVEHVKSLGRLTK